MRRSSILLVVVTCSCSCYVWDYFFVENRAIPFRIHCLWDIECYDFVKTDCHPNSQRLCFPRRSNDFVWILYRSQRWYQKWMLCLLTAPCSSKWHSSEKTAFSEKLDHCHTNPPLFHRIEDVCHRHHRIKIDNNSVWKDESFLVEGFFQLNFSRYLVKMQRSESMYMYLYFPENVGWRSLCFHHLMQCRVDLRLPGYVQRGYQFLITSCSRIWCDSPMEVLCRISVDMLSSRLLCDSKQAIA